MTNETSLPIKEINSYTEKIIGCAFRVSNQLGSGFVEKVYENALILEFRKEGINYEQQVPL